MNSLMARLIVRTGDEGSTLKLDQVRIELREGAPKACFHAIARALEGGDPNLVAFVRPPRDSVDGTAIGTFFPGGCHMQVSWPCGRHRVTSKASLGIGEAL